MKIDLKPGDVSQQQELIELKRVLFSRMKDAKTFNISLENTKGIDLAQFNALIKVYVSLKRMGKRVIYSNCKDQGLTNLIYKTNFDHVFEI